MTHWSSPEIDEVVKMVSAADGEFTGRMRMHKTAFLLDLVNLADSETGFKFRDRRYGPYSEQLADAIHLAPFLSDFKEEELRASWGGTYSVFQTNQKYGGEEDDAYRKIVLIAKQADPVILEVAITAVCVVEYANPYLKGPRPEPWEETARRKPPEYVANGGLEDAEKLYEDAKDLYARFKAVDVPTPLPDI